MNQCNILSRNKIIRNIFFQDGWFTNEKFRPQANKTCIAYVTTLCWFGDNTWGKQCAPEVWFAWLLFPVPYGHLTELRARTQVCTNTLRQRQNGHHVTDDNFKHISFNKNVRILTKISRLFVPKGPKSNIPALVQIMAWQQPGDKPLSEPMMIRLPMHISVWYKTKFGSQNFGYQIW